MKKTLLAKLFPLFSVVLFMAACGQKPDIVGPTPETGRLVSISTDVPVYSLDFSSETVVNLTVEESNAEFDFDVDSDRCALSLAGSDESTDAPSDIIIGKIEKGTDAGIYRVTLAYKGDEDHYTARVRLALTGKETTCFTEAFQVMSADVFQGIRSIGFGSDLNPQLKGEITMKTGETGFTFTGRTPSYLEDMKLIATFDCKSIVTVDGVEQQSGVTVNDFKNPVEYVIRTNTATLTYTVSVSNFTLLPIISITTDDGHDITSKSVWKGATIKVDGKGHFENIDECPIQIRGRGNTTWNWSKKPYVFKFEKRHKVLGMPEHKRWVLLANLMDRTLMRNKVSYHIAEQTSLAWTPRTEYAELYINGKHKGNYLLTEQIRVDENRIDIAEMSDQDNSGKAVTGGYLFELDFHFDNRWQWRTSRNLPIAIKYPDEDDLTTEQYNYAKAYVNEADRVINDSNFRDPETGYKKYFDIQSFVDYWFVYEICINHEIGNPGSVFVHKDRDGKLTAGPIWDFDWGTFSYNVSPWARGILFLQGTLWYGRMFGDPEFKALAKERWSEIYPKLLPIGDYIEEQREYISDSAVQNFKLSSPTEAGTINGDERISFDEAVDRMKNIYLERIETINSIVMQW